MRVRLEDVTVALGGRDVVHAATLTAEPGTVVGLLGPNGSGKSTLLRTLYRAVRPRLGTVRLDDVDIASMSGREAARAVSVMLQDPHTDFDLTVHELVLLDFPTWARTKNSTSTAGPHASILVGCCARDGHTFISRMRRS